MFFQCPKGRLRWQGGQPSRVLIGHNSGGKLIPININLGLKLGLCGTPAVPEVSGRGCPHHHRDLHDSIYSPTFG